MFVFDEGNPVPAKERTQSHLLHVGSVFCQVPSDRHSRVVAPFKMYPSKQEYIAEVTVPEVERVYVPLPGEDNVWH